MNSNGLLNMRSMNVTSDSVNSFIHSSLGSTVLNITKLTLTDTGDSIFIDGEANLESYIGYYTSTHTNINIQTTGIVKYRTDYTYSALGSNINIDMNPPTLDATIGGHMKTEAIVDLTSINLTRIATQGILRITPSMLISEVASTNSIYSNNTVVVFIMASIANKPTFNITEIPNTNLIVSPIV